MAQMKLATFKQDKLQSLIHDAIALVLNYGSRPYSVIVQITLMHIWEDKVEPNEFSAKPPSSR